MTNVERLQQWIEEEKGKGLIDINFFLTPNKNEDIETVCGSVLKLLDNKAKGEYTVLASTDNRSLDK